MIKNKELEKLENSSVKLTLTIEKDSAQKEYEDLVKKYSKEAHIKGFRKGKAPAAVMEQKFGDTIRMEVSMKVIEDSLKQVFDEIDEKPLPYAQPELQEGAEMELGSDFKFQVVYDVFPEVTMGSYKGLTVEEPQVKIADEDIERELKQYQEQNAIVVEKEADAAAEGDIVTIDYWELGEDGEIDESSKREDFVFTVGTGYNIYKVDDEVTGMKKDEEKTFEKEFPEDYEYAELAGTKKKIGVKVKLIKERQLPDLDDELAQDISDDYETLDDLKKSIRDKLGEQLESRLRQAKIDHIMDQLIESSSFEIPKSMLNAELENSWRNFAMQSRMPEDQLMQLLAIQQKSKEMLFEEWTPMAEKSIRNQILMGKMIEEEKIEVSDEELDKEIETHAEKNGMEVSEMKDYYSKNRMTEYLRNDIQTKKLFDLLFESSTIKKGKKMSFMDLSQKKD